MKKLLTLLLVVALVFTLFVFTGCGRDDVDTDTDTNSGNVNTDTDTNSHTPEADEDLQAAYDYIKLTYKTLGTTATSFEIMKNAPIGDKIFAITWSTDNDAITITETEDGNFYVVNIPALGETAVNYSLKFSIQNEAGEKKEGSFSLTVPKFAVNTFEEYAAAEDGTPLIIQGIVTGVISKTTNSTKENSLFIQDLNGNGGYYAYNLAEDPAGKISVGMTVEVRGNKKNYNGTFELTSPVATVIDSTIKTVTPVDFTSILAGADSLDADELTGKNGMLVTIKGVTILEYVEGNGYHYFKLGDHKTYLRVSSSSNCITKEEGKTLTANFIENFYNSADVTGIIAVYNNDFYLMPVSVNAFTNVVELEKPADVKVDTTLANTKLPGMIQVAGNTELPTSFSGFSDVTITWELVTTEGVNCATLNGNTLTVTIPTEAQTVTLKATATCGDTSDTKDYTIIVKPITTITILEANNIGMNMAHNTYTEELYYIVGTVDSIASDVYGNLFLVDGEYSIYIYGLYDATGKVRYDKMNPQPLVKDTIKVLSSVGKYSNDVQLKNAKVIEHTVHEDNKVQGGDNPGDEIVDTNPSYIFGMTQANCDNKIYYLAGGMDGYYMATTEDKTSALKVYLETTDGGYYFYCYVAGAKTYINMVLNDTHVNGAYESAPSTVYTLDAEKNTLIATVNDAPYWFGTRNDKSYTTMGPCKTEYNGFYGVLYPTTVEGDDNTGDDNTGDEVVDTNPSYIFGMTQENCDNKIYYLAGGMDGYYMATTENQSAALKVYLESTEGGYYFYCYVAGAKTYINMVLNDTHVNGAYESAPSTVYTLDAEKNTIIATVNDAPYWFGTRNDKTYTTMGPCKTEYNGFYGVLYPTTVEDDDNTGDDNTPEETVKEYTISEALELAVGDKLIVSGTVTGIYRDWSDSYGNISVYISDENNNQILCFNLTTKVGIGDAITVTGEIGVYNDVNQVVNGTAVINEAHVCSEYTEATCQKLAECVVCGAKTGERGPHAFSNGVCSVCGVDEDSLSTKTEMSVSKSHTDIAGITGVTAGQNTGVIADKNIALNEDITLVCAKGSSTSDPCIYSESIRMYQGGSTMTFKAAASCEMTTIVIHLSSKSGGQGPISVTGGTASELTNNTYTITVDAGATEVVITTTGTDKNNRLYVDNISVDYLK